MPLPIVALEPEFVLINKPPGIGFHDESGEPGVVTLMRQQLGEPLLPVHRLDKVTSGLLLLARNPESCRQLCELFAEHQMAKFYLALSDRKPKKKQGTVAGDMVKARRGSWKLLHSRNQAAVTRFISHSIDEGMRAFLLRPQTGKTHQIRVALKSLGSPILGDSLYSGSSGDRCYLHAWALAFTLNGRDYCYQVNPPAGELFSSTHLATLPANWLTPWQLKWPGSK
ncbi:TIGR01621 family pseudouridine synthase [Dongshaea marina]|uniref:TIGR01621 family pseudouridine synthase n=1 Tax=Dongshaea marina TaxID=2047966 RepID=UPI0018FFC547|nr:TIGR01621 family pseudouridine synthase [Dongshaea marina]